MSTPQEIANEVFALPYWTKADPKQSALLILPGVQEYRISEGAKHWPDKAEHLWVAGTRADPFYTRREILDIVREVTTIESGTYLIENGGWENHTPHQMRWTVELLKKNPGVNHLIVCTAAYHAPRCVLTCIKIMQRHAAMRVISVLPLWHSEGPSSESAEWIEEMERISMYQQKGDVVSWEEWKQYLSWRTVQ